MDTIAALSTPVGRSALALIRVSGPQAKALALSLAGLTEVEIRKPKVGILKNSAGKLLDEAVVTFFEGPNSYTGEDLLEISCHGNPVIVERILADIVSRETFRLAEPGEFSRRALANERLSLDEVEGLDLILNAETKRGVELGLGAKLGGLRENASILKQKLLDLAVELESQLDFQENEVGDLGTEAIVRQIDQASQELQSWEQAFDRNRQYLNASRIVLAGEPNSGKSTLFNRLIGQEKAIVHATPGTTRDFLEHKMEIEGLPFVLSDTAGVRAGSSDPIEVIGIERSLKCIAAADLVIWVSDAGKAPEASVTEQNPRKPWIWVQSKADLTTGSPGSEWLSVSAKTDLGLGALVNRLVSFISRPQLEGDAPIISERQAKLIAQAREALTQSSKDLKAGAYLDQVTERVRTAGQLLDDLVPRAPTESILKEIFARFCIGK